MVVHLIAGMPAAGKDTLGRIISQRTGNQHVSLRRDLLIPLVEDRPFRQEVSRRAGVDLTFLEERSYPPGRPGLIALGDDLNVALRSSRYFHFADLAYVLYGNAVIIPSFRQKTMLDYLQSQALPYRTILIECSTEIRQRRWAWRDGISKIEMEQEDQIELSKYFLPLHREVTYDLTVDNSGSFLDLEQIANTFVTHDQNR